MTVALVAGGPMPKERECCIAAVKLADLVRAFCGEYPLRQPGPRLLQLDEAARNVLAECEGLAFPIPGSRDTH